MKLPKIYNTKKGFTLIELLIAVAIVGIIAVGAFVALDPLTRFQNARDATRWTDVTAVLDAAKVDQIDNGGAYIAAIDPGIIAGNYAMIGSDPTGCDTVACPDQTMDVAACVDLDGLRTEGYISQVPVAPTAPGGATYTTGKTGYYISRATTGILTVGACDSENATSIEVIK